MVNSVVMNLRGLLQKMSIDRLASYVVPINRYTIYVLTIFIWAPHGAKECVTVCNGPNFVAPMIFTFLAPNWTMDMSLHGWVMQLLFSPPIFLLVYAIFRFAKKKWGIFLEVYIVRWTIVWYGVLAYYNFVFWYGPLRQFVFPLFVF